MKTFRVEFKQGVTKEEFIDAENKQQAIDKVASREYVQCVYGAKLQPTIKIN